MKCGFCGREFTPTEADQACESCPVVKGCHLVRCPYCGYEMPPEPALLRWLSSLKDRRKHSSTIKETSK